MPFRLTFLPLLTWVSIRTDEDIKKRKERKKKQDSLLATDDCPAADQP
jgi:hypothetical protein